MTVVVKAQNLRQVYKIRRGMFREPAQLVAVGGVSFEIEAGRTLAVVGESGCGKSTLARMVALIEKPAGGTLQLDGTDAVATPQSEKRRLRQAVQLVFQNPYGSLNPRKKVSAVLEAPLETNLGLKVMRVFTTFPVSVTSKTIPCTLSARTTGLALPCCR